MDSSDRRLEILANHFQGVSALREADLAGRERLGQLAFTEEEVGVAHKILAIMDELRELPLEELPNKRIEALGNAIQKAKEPIVGMRDISTATTQNTAEVKGRLVGNLHTSFDDLVATAAPLIAYLRSTSGAFSLLERMRDDGVAAIRSEIQASTNSLRELEQEGREILESMRKAAAEVGVSQHATHFAVQAQEHLKTGRAWLWATAILGLLTGVAALFMVLPYLRITKPLDAGLGIQIAVGKLLFFSVLYFAVVWSARNHRSHMHNYVMAKHRQNALSTFQAFAKATTDEITRNAVLLKATEAIFAIGLSGYDRGIRISKWAADLRDSARDRTKRRLTYSDEVAETYSGSTYSPSRHLLLLPSTYSLLPV